jgi:hypothetical protein
MRESTLIEVCEVTAMCRRPHSLRLGSFVMFVMATAAAAQPSVLLAYADSTRDANEVAGKLQALGAFATVDLHDATSAPPSLALLQSYDAVLVWSDNGFASPATIGDNLADYVDGGGGVVMAVFSTASVPVAGRFASTDYYCIRPSGQQQGTTEMLGQVFVPGHPILSGVVSFSGGSSSYRPQQDNLHPQATRIANWTSGTIPLVATRTINGVRRADLGFFPPSSDSRGDFWDRTTDGDLLMGNALLWVAGSDFVRIRTVTAAAMQVAAGQTGVAVSFTAENVGSNAVDVSLTDLSFLDSMQADVSSEYTVTPDPGNPVTIAPGATETFIFDVDVGALATLGTITVDGVIEVIDPTTMVTARDAGADTPDSWGVVSAAAAVRVVDAVPMTVSQGSAGHPVSVTVESLGLNPIIPLGVALSFTGTADRTLEYSVAADPGNPTFLAAGATETWRFTVDVSPMATVETITIDASFGGLDAVQGTVLIDQGADVTDTWDLATCAVSLCGDCNQDGVVSILDALVGAQHAAGLVVLAGMPFTACNVIGLLEPDPGALVDILDALTIAQSAAGLPATLTCC